MSALARLTEEDITFSTDRDPVTNEVLVHGLGDVHLDVALERMKRKFGVDAELHPPKIPYRETITGTARVGAQVQEAVRRRRAVRRRDDRDRAAAARRRLRVGGQDLRRLDPAPVPPLGREGRAPDHGTGCGHRQPDRRRQGAPRRRLDARRRRQGHRVSDRRGDGDARGGAEGLAGDPRADHGRAA